MRDYIILNNKNSNEIKGLLIQNLPPITKPRIRAEIEEIDGRDGDIVTPLGYGAYDKVFSIGLYGNFDINEVIKYFDSEGIVVFSNEPNKYYNYKILEQIDFEKLIRFRTADVMMHVQPFKYSTTEGKETEEMETKTASGSEINLPDTNNEKLQMEKLKGDTHQDTIDAEEGNENEDTNLAVNDVDPSKENYITLKGNTTQYNHDSVNMLPNDMATLSLYGITITKNDDGTYTINGTTTQDFNWAINDTALNLQANTNYFLSGCATGGDAETYCLYISTYADTGNGVLINSSRAINDQVRIFIASGQTFNNAVFKPMLIEGTEAIPFEPYGMTTPSPQYPSEVKVVKGENVVSVQGKNLASSVEYFNPKNRFYRVIGATYSVVEGKKYAVSFDTQNTGIAVYNQGASNIKIALSPYSVTCDGTRQTFIGTATETGTFSVTSFIARASVDSDIGTGLCSNFMIEEIPSDSSTATPYVPYSKTDYPINLGNIELCKIGNYQDYLYKNNGKWYVHKEIGKYFYNDDLTTNGITADRVDFLTPVLNVQPNVASVANIAFCNMMSANSINKTGLNGTTSTSKIRIGVSTNYGTTYDEIKNIFANFNLTIYYGLSTPTEEEITDTSLIAQLDALHTAELQETSYINSTPAKEYPYINLKYNVVTPAPSPDRSSEINKVTGNNVISVQGKNLFDVPEEYKVVSSISNIPISIEAGRYIISVDSISVDSIITDGSIDTSSIIFYYEDGTAYATIYLSNTSKSKTLNFTKKVTKYNIYSQNAWTTSQGVTATFNKLMIRSQSIADDTYVPYSKTDYPISLGTLELCKIGNYKDYFHKDSGKWYVHKEIGKVILDGSETWNKASEWSNIGPNSNAYTSYKSTMPNAKTNAQGTSNYFIHNARAYATDKNGLFQFSTFPIFRISKAIAPTTTDFKNWLSTHNSIVYYQLATPTEEEITDETLLAQLEALDNIYNQKGTTKIKTNPEGNNMPLALDVSYTESKPITITNSGNIYSKPIFTIYGEGDIEVYLNDIQLFNINLGSEEQITIDVAEMQAYNKETKALKNRLVTGNYDNFVLKVGENTISFSGIVKKFEIENYSRWI